MSQCVEVPAEKLPPVGGRSLFRHDGKSLVLFNQNGEIYAIDEGCPHNGASLFSGRLEGRLLRCPAHGLRFDLATGCVPGVSGFGVATYAVELQQGRCFIDLSRPRPQESIVCLQQQ
ncbi:Rieske 2Fe-2S domain-containing protein [Pseudomonas sp. JS3066]|jgi:nitrite reductase/ring-hydroxylating ferredoxin subunit|uniref:Rieske (2Fe-2S) protein n=1 Tax=unclassified Pseudomonas TaxID=196821 RepID=UPI000EA907D2|nr:MULTISPECIES: Rieske 2Fe-2S domain-containing protein [unclassified Pseudomonas]AYF86510.1 Rieske (2Fe-2S) protein [Pseudomonas sp. DY-1]MDH4654767.1 Rieske (2Fe-2S) protein [Pseudomonas sp. BN606]MRK23849.1 Rieske 2Fe-2S domain-containing protein [Pseudomonas sp. JG-B]WVK96033.1 Rieske 2Fe-2S domain-containing protein [Pseudomonas sp. JS3066]